MNFEERKAEIFRRSEARIARRRRNHRIGLSVALPVLMVAVLAVPVSRLLPNAKEENPREQLGVQNAALAESIPFHRNETNNPGQTKPESWDLAKDPIDGFVSESAPEPTIGDYSPNVTQPPVGASPSPDSSNPWGLVLNRLEKAPSQPDMDVVFEYLNPDLAEDQLSFRQLTGLDYGELISRLPWTADGKLTLYGVLVNSGKGEYTLRDYVLVYSPREDWQIQLTLSPIGWPEQELIYPQGNPGLSRVNGVEMTVYGYGNTHIVRFQFQGLYYEVQTKGLEFPQITPILAGLTKESGG